MIAHRRCFFLTVRISLGALTSSWSEGLANRESGQNRPGVWITLIRTTFDPHRSIPRQPVFEGIQSCVSFDFLC